MVGAGFFEPAVEFWFTKISSIQPLVLEQMDYSAQNR